MKTGGTKPAKLGAEIARLWRWVGCGGCNELREMEEIEGKEGIAGPSGDG